LKKLFRKKDSMSGIFNWLVEGYRLLTATGLSCPPRVELAIEEYRSEADIIGVFLSDYTVRKDDGRVSTAELYALYSDWAKANGYKPLSNRSFTIDLNRRFEIRRTGADGRVVIGLAIKVKAA